MKKQLFYILFTVCFLLGGMTSYSQDPNYSQFFVSPLTISPALAGKSDAKLEANSIYRKQSFGAGVNYNTKLISVDGRLFENYDNNNTIIYIGEQYDSTRKYLPRGHHPLEKDVRNINDLINYNDFKKSYRPCGNHSKIEEIWDSLNDIIIDDWVIIME